MPAEPAAPDTAAPGPEAPDIAAPGLAAPPDTAAPDPAASGPAAPPDIAAPAPAAPGLRRPEPDPQAVFLDLDNTIIAGSSALAFARPFARHGLIDRATVARGAWAQLLLVLSGADAATMDTLRKRMILVSTGWEVRRVREIVAETLQEVIGPLVYPEAVRMIEWYRAKGSELVLLSASGLEVVEPIAELVGIDRFRASTMRVEDGRYAGELEFYCYGEGKADAAREIAAESGLDLARCAAYSDSITDLPLLEVVGRPAVVNPDRELRAVARARGWPVHGFVRAASRRDRLFRLRDRLGDRWGGRAAHRADRPAGPGPEECAGGGPGKRAGGGPGERAGGGPERGTADRAPAAPQDRVPAAPQDRALEPPVDRAPEPPAARTPGRTAAVAAGGVLAVAAVALLGARRAARRDTTAGRAHRP